MTSGWVEANRVRLHYLEAGAGPAVILLHGFPETADSWRHQLPALAAAGYRAIALDMRGHGNSDSPTEPEAYDVLHTVGDVIGLLDALEIERAVVVGHDAGTTAAYHAALMRPDRVRGVVGLSVPYRPRGPISMVEAFKGNVPPGFYMDFFREVGVSEADLERDVGQTLRGLYFANSGENPDAPILMIAREGGGLIETLPQPSGEMAFLPEDVLERSIKTWTRTGFTGGLNGYRVFQRNWEVTAPWNGMALPVPSAFIGGLVDTVLLFPGMREAAEAMGQCTLIDGAGHWIQAERPTEVNEALVRFAASLPED